MYSSGLSMPVPGKHFSECLRGRPPRMGLTILIVVLLSGCGLDRVVSRGALPPDCNLPGATTYTSTVGSSINATAILVDTMADMIVVTVANVFPERDSSFGWSSLSITSTSEDYSTDLHPSYLRLFRESVITWGPACEVMTVGFSYCPFNAWIAACQPLRVSIEFTR